MPDLLESTVEERTSTTPPATPAAPPSRRVERPRRQPSTVLLTLTLLCSLVGALCGGGGLYLYWQSLQEEEIPTPAPEILEEVEEFEGVDFLRYNDNYLPIYDNIGVNLYDLDAFEVVDGKITYPDAQIGIDVSQHQGDIDWEAVAADGVTFAMIRLGCRGYGQEGNIILDENYHQNMEGAKAAGLDVGVYFFSQATSVWETAEEAYFVLEHLAGYELDLPVVFDWEFISYSSTARTNGALGRSITLYAQVFCEEMKLAGYEPAVYFNQNLAYLYLELDKLADYPFWLASYRDSPNFYYHFDMWQYSDTGSVDGIDGYVDLNLLFAP